MKVSAGRRVLNSFLYLFALVGAATIIYNAFFIDRLTTKVAAQRDPFLSQRLSQIEQRYALLEARLNRIEQEARMSSALPPAVDNTDTTLRLFGTRIDLFQQRLADLECGLLRLDERTLPPAARRAGEKAPTAEPCRANANAPLVLSGR